MTLTVDLRGRNALNAKQLAADRNRSFEDNNRWDNEVKSYGVSPDRRNYCGIMGEFAFARRYKLPVDKQTYEKTDTHGDFYVEYEGERRYFDVKTTQKEPYALFVKEGCVSADYYVLGHLKENEQEGEWRVTFYGMTAHEDVLATDLSDTPYDHRNHEILIEELDPLPEPDALKPVG